MATDALVLAGGLGTRLQPVTGGLMPKALVPVLGRPFIDYKLRSLHMLGVSRVVVSVGQGAEQVVEHVGSGQQYGLEVDYVRDGPVLLGTAGAVAKAIPLLPSTFWLTYGDTMVEAPLDAIEAQLQRNATAEAVMTVLENADRWEISNVDVRGKRVIAYAKGAPAGSHRWLDYGLLLFRSDVFHDVDPLIPSDLTSVIQPLIERGQMLAAPVHTRFWEVGTPDALRATEAHFASTSMWHRLS